MMYLLITVISVISFRGSDDLPKPQDKPMFQPPQGWKVTRRSESVLFFDAPAPAESCRIAVASPMEAKGSITMWFGMVQAPDPVVTESKVTEGKTKGGYKTLRQTKVVMRRSGEVHRHYCGLECGKGFVLILYSAPNEELFKKHLGEVDKLLDSWDATGTFSSEPKEKK